MKGYEMRSGYCANLNYIKPGLDINSIELRALRGAQYARSGGTGAKLVSITDLVSIIKLKSKTLIKVANSCIAQVGLPSPFSASLNYITKQIDLIRNAGYTRRKGIRPSVRGVAMNPIDHPHGGGQGKTSGGRPSVTP